MNEAIVISDIHLGSDVCQAKKLIEFLKRIELTEVLTKKLIINGDLFDNLDFRKLKKSHWKVLSHLRKISGILDVVWIKGNHDGPAEIISHLIGVDFLEEYELILNEKKILFLHGDKFDSFIAKRPILTKLADNFYRWIQKIDPSFYFAKLLKKGSKTLLHCSEQIQKKAKDYALKKGFNVVICSHVHLEMEDRSGKVEYYNTGCWTEDPCCYLVITLENIKIERI